MAERLGINHREVFAKDMKNIWARLEREIVYRQSKSSGHKRHLYTKILGSLRYSVLHVTEFPDPSNLTYETLIRKRGVGKSTVKMISEVLKDLGYELKGMPQKRVRKAKKICPHCGSKYNERPTNG